MKGVFRATIIVTIFAVLTRAFGFLLRIFLSRIMGAEVLGSYQIAMSVFGVLLTIISSGIPLIVSRNVAYHEGKDQQKQSKNITAGLVVCLMLSLFLCIVFWALSGVLRTVMSFESVNMLLILLPSLVVSSIYVILRSALWGRKYFFTISFTEFFEQIARLIFIAILFAMPLKLSSGEKSALSLTLSTIVSCILVVALYFYFGGKLSKPRGEIVPIIKTSTPITFVRAISSVIGSIIAIILPTRLMLFGYTHGEALAVFGTFMGMTMPLLMIPTTFISSIAVALVPELSEKTNDVEHTNQNNLQTLKMHIMSAINATIAISFVLLPAFVAIGVPIGQVLFNNQNAGIYIASSCFLMLPMGINQICSSILNAIGLEKKELRNYAIGAILLVGCVFVLPQFIGGYSIPVGLGIMNITSATLSLFTLKSRNLLDFSCATAMIKCVFICIPTIVLGYFLQNILSSFMGLFLSTFISGAITVFCTMLLMLVFNISNIKVIAIKFKERHNKKVFSKQITAK